MIAPSGGRARRRARTAAILLACLAATGVALGARSKKAELASTWRAGDTIAIDGVNDEWTGHLAPLKDGPVSVAFLNDDKFLYFCLTTSDRGARTLILRQGLTVWFDQAGGKKKAFGVEYPVNLGGMMVVERRGDTGEPGMGARPLDADQDRIVILGPGKDDRENLRLDEAPGIRAKIGEANGVLVYELRVPLRKTGEATFGIGTAPNAIVGIGLLTPEFQRPADAYAGGGGRAPGGGGGWGGGIGGRGGFPGGGRGRPAGGRGAFDRDAAKPLKVWTTVQLAEG